MYILDTGNLKPLYGVFWKLYGFDAKCNVNVT